MTFTNKFSLALLLLLTAVSGVIRAEDREGAVKNRWSVRAGVNLSHICADTNPWDYSTMTPVPASASFGWGAGAMFGGAYDIRFNRTWSLTPGLEIQYIDNGGKKHGGYYDNMTDDKSRDRNAFVMHSWNVVVPVLMNMRAPISRSVGFRVGAGPYVSEAFSARAYNASGKMEDFGGDFGHYFDFGLIGEMAVETGDHFSYFYRLQYPLLKDHIHHRTLTMSLGLSYTF